MFKTEEANQLKELYRRISASQVPPEIDAVIRRFNFAYERWRTDDRITDLVIALESLYVSDSEGGEIGYKFRTRLAAVLGGGLSAPDRRRLRDVAKAAYDVRSLLVHGVKDEKKIATKLKALDLRSLEKFGQEIEEIARTSIRRFIDTPQFLEASVLDSLVLDLSNTSQAASSGS